MIDLKKIIAIVSYPKSGNTWMRFILCNLLYPKINHDFDTICRCAPTYESEKEMRFAKRKRILLVKSHMLGDKSEFHNVIYIVRDIREVLVSFYYHNKKFYGLKKSLPDFIKDMNYGEDWRLHLDSWVHKKDSNIIVISYDCLMKNTNDAISKIIVAFGLSYNEHEIKTAVEKSKFEALRKIERTKGVGILYRKNNSKIPFIRNGRKKSINEELSRYMYRKLYTINENMLAKIK